MKLMSNKQIIEKINDCIEVRQVTSIMLDNLINQAKHEVNENRTKFIIAIVDKYFELKDKEEE